VIFSQALGLDAEPRGPSLNEQWDGVVKPGMSLPAPRQAPRISAPEPFAAQAQPATPLKGTFGPRHLATQEGRADPPRADARLSTTQTSTLARSTDLRALQPAEPVNVACHCQIANADSEVNEPSGSKRSRKIFAEVDQ
jgi:hypothetical protein